MLILEVLFILVLQCECSIKLSLTKEIPTISRELFSLPTDDTALVFAGMTRMYILTANFSIGTPPSQFKLCLSSYDSFLWVEKSNYENRGMFEKQYDPSKSSTYKDMDETQGYYWTWSNQTYSWSGAVGKDIVKMGNIEFEPYVVVATFSTDVDLNISFYDGVIGFAFKTDGYDYSTFLDALFEAGKIEKKIFSLYLNKLHEDPTVKPEDCSSSKLEIGGFDLETYSSTGKILVTIPITMDDYWGTDLVDVYFDGEKLNIHGGVVFDIAAYGVLANEADFLEIAKYVIDKNPYCSLVADVALVCNCPDFDSLPNMYLKYDGVILEFNRTSLWYNMGGVCYSNIAKSYDENWHVGSALTTQYYTIFDIDNKEISLAPVALTIVEKNDEDDENNDDENNDDENDDDEGNDDENDDEEGNGEVSSGGFSTTGVFSLLALSLVN